MQTETTEDPSKLNIRGLRFDEAQAALASRFDLGEGRLAADVYLGIHRDCVESIGGIKTLGRDRKRDAQSVFDDRGIELVERRASQSDPSVRHVFKLADGAIVETVLLWHHDQWTACVSSQAGCPLACRFCATGMLGLERSLEAWEIVAQVQAVGRLNGVRVSDIVFMGMGEPLLNEDAVMQAAEIFNDARGAQIGRKRITISTAGVVPAIHRFIDEGRRWRLVFSLTSAIPEKRAQLMPIQERHSFDELIDAIRRYESYRGGKHVTLEYIAIKNLTMGDEDVAAIRDRLSGFRFILNVIPYNPVANDELEAPTQQEVRRWTEEKLRPLGIPVKVRYSGGKDELAGCGQLGQALMEEGRLQRRRS